MCNFGLYRELPVVDYTASCLTFEASFSKCCLKRIYWNSDARIAVDMFCV